MPLFKTGLLILFSLILISCSESTSNLLKAEIEINLPIDQKAVYANAGYTERNDSLILNTLKMNSINLTDQIKSNDSTYLFADVQEFIPESFENSGTNNGTLKFSLTDKWVSIENENGVSSSFFYKTTIDTTAVPSNNFQHNAIYPRVLIEEEVKEIVRPAGGSFYFRKKFRVGREIKWDDAFGFGTGLYLETQSTFGSNDTLFTIAIYDEHGLMISQYSLDFIINNIDTIRVHYISRRVADYNNPLLIGALSSYADQVIEKDLTPIYR